MLNVFNVSVSSGQTPPAEPSGPWPIGFSVVRMVDSSRTLTSGKLRPLDLGIWYPAQSTSQTPLTYRDYFLASATTEELEQFTQFLVSHGAGAADVTTWLEAPMRAIRDAALTDRRFPLVLIAQGNGQAFNDQAPLAEYLASHGYIVATTPSPMRVTGPLSDESEVGARAAEQATDLEMAAAFLIRRRHDVSKERIGVICHSFGARAGVLMMMHEPRVAALVSLDGGIGTATGRSSMEAVPEYRARAVRAPILHFYEEWDSDMTHDFTLLLSFTQAERWIRLVPLHHHLFSSLGAASISQPGLRSAIAATDSTGGAYAAVESETLVFLNAFLKRDRAARSRLSDMADRPPLGRLERLPTRF
jgi:dienelactone hydrolase